MHGATIKIAEWYILHKLISNHAAFFLNFRQLNPVVFLNQRYKIKSVKHNCIFSSNQLHVSTIYGHHQAGHKTENKYSSPKGSCVDIFSLVASLMMTIYGRNM
jgi:hypothetical protein